MPNKNNSRKNNVKKAASAINSKWLQNTLKSMGMAGTEVIKDLMPATSDTMSSATSVARDVAQSMRSNRSATKYLTDAMKTNPIIRVGQEFFKNAVEDIKTGNIYNTERESSGEGDPFNDMDTAFGDMDEMFGSEDNNTVNVENKIVNQSNEDTGATLKAIQKQTEYQVKSTKASVDTMVSLSSVSMQKTAEIGMEILSQLGTINSNLAAMVEYNSTNMTKFIEASIGYYEQMSIKEDDAMGSKKIKSTDIFSANGSLDLSTYGEYIKGNISNLKNDSLIGQSLQMIIDNKDMFISNPLGMIAQGVLKASIPKVLKSSMEALDNTIKDLLPVMLEKVGKLGENETGVKGTILSTIGKIFGIKSEEKKDFDTSKIKKGPVPYNGIVNHTIIEIIPKYLRESNTYLREIAEVVTGKSNDQLSEGFTGFDWETGKFKNINEMQSAMYDNVINSIVGTFEDSDFGKKMSANKDLLKSETDQNKYNDALSQFYVLLEKQGSSLDLKNTDMVNEIMSNISSTDSVKNLIKATIEQMYESGDTQLQNNITATRQRANTAKNREMKNIEEYSNENGLHQINNKESIYDYSARRGASLNSNAPQTANVNVSVPSLIQGIQRTLDRGIYVQIKNKLDDVNSPQSVPTIEPATPEEVQSKDDFKQKLASNVEEEASLDTGDDGSVKYKIANKAANKLNTFSKILNGLLAGNADQAWDEFMNGIKGVFTKAGTWLSENFLNPIKTTLFGEKDTDGYLRGGIFEGVNNRMKESFFSFRRMLTGKGYKLSDGTDVPDAEGDELNNTVAGKLKSMLNNLKEGIRVRLFGEKDENGETTKEGFLGKAKNKIGSAINSFYSGITGWKNALFGTEDDVDDKDKAKKTLSELKDKFVDVLPSALTGTVVGATGGALTGGILGTLVGGPIGGALLGFAGGIASKSERFNNWLFGEKDEDGERSGGVISKNIQDYFKKNGKYLVGGGAIGMLHGAFTGGGLLGTLVGGPVAGAITGMATSMLWKSDMWQKFLYGDDTSGQLGLIKTVKNMFKGFGTNKNGDASGGKLAGMAGIGAGVGAITIGTLTNAGIFGLALGPAGPIGGAILGLGAAIIAQKDNFKEWLFGEKDDKGNVLKEGIIGKFKNMLVANVFTPVGNTVKDIAADFKTFLQYDILNKFNLIIEPIGNAVFGTISKVTGKVMGSFGDLATYIKEDFLENVVEKARAILSPVTRAVSTVAKGIYGVGKMIVKTPLNLLYAITSPIAQATTKLFATIAKTAFKGIDLLLIKPIKNLIIKPAGALLKAGFKIVSAPFKIIAGVADFVNDRVKRFSDHVSKFFTKIGIDFKVNIINPIKDEIKVAVKKFVSPVTDFVKEAVTEVKNETKKILKAGLKSILKLITSPFRAIKWAGDKIFDFISGTGKGNGKDKGRAKGPFSYFINAWRDTGKSDYQQDYSGAADNMSNAERRRANENAKRSQREKNRQEARERRLHERNQKNIAKYTNNQFVEDTVANRKAAEAAAGLKGKSLRWGGVEATDKKFLDDQKRAEKEARKNQKRTADNTEKSAKIGERIEKLLSNLSRGLSRIFNHKPPGYAEGTDNADAGLAEVGEVGPELVINPDGTRSIVGVGGSHFRNMTGGEIVISNSNLSNMVSENSGMSMLDNSDLVGTSDETRLNIGMRILREIIRTKESICNRLESLGGFGGGSEIGSFDFIDVGDSQESEQEEQRNRAQLALAEQTTLTGDNMHAQAELEAAKEAESDRENTKVSLLQKLFKGQREHSNVWNSIFSKKGLITAGLIMLSPYVYKLIKRILGLNFGDLLKNIGGFASGVVEDVQRQKQFGEENDTLENGDTPEQRMIANADQFFSGNPLMFNADGSSSNQTSARGTLVRNGLIVAAKTTTGKALIKKVTTAASGLQSKTITYVNKFFSTISTKFKVKPGIFKTMSQSKVVTAIKTHWSKIVGKIQKVLGKETAEGAAAVSTAGMTLIITKTLDLINGVTGTAKLFHIKKTEVDTLMTAISAGMGIFVGTIVGAIIDVINQLIFDINNIDFLSSIATEIYNALSDESAQSKLANAKESFETDYLDYKTEEIEKQYETQIKAGLIDANVSMDEFKQGVVDGTYNANFKSFANYNTEQNASLYDKAFTTVGKGLKGIKNLVTGNKAKTYKDEVTGNKFVKNDDGTYEIYDVAGNDLGYINEKAIPETAVKVESTSRKTSIGKAGSSLGASVAKAGGGLLTGIGNAFNTPTSVSSNGIAGINTNINNGMLSSSVTMPTAVSANPLLSTQKLNVSLDQSSVNKMLSNATQSTLNQTLSLSGRISQLYADKIQETEKWIDEIDSDDSYMSGTKDGVLASLKKFIQNNIEIVWAVSSLSATKNFNIALGIDEETNNAKASMGATIGGSIGGIAGGIGGGILGSGGGPVGTILGSAGGVAGGYMLGSMLGDGIQSIFNTFKNASNGLRVDKDIKQTVKTLSEKITDLFVSTADSTADWADEFSGDSSIIPEETKDNVINNIKQAVGANITNIWAVSGAVAVKQFNIALGIDEETNNAKASLGSTIGGAIGSIGGGILGGILGSGAGPVGTILGSAGGAAGGYMVGSMLGDGIQSFITNIAKAAKKPEEKYKNAIDVLSDKITTVFTDTAMSTTDWADEILGKTDFLGDDMKQTVISTLKQSVASGVASIWAASAAVAIKRFNIELGIDEETNNAEKSGAQTVGGVVGAATLGTIGAILGSGFGPGGTIIGGTIGATLGSGIGSSIGGKIYEWAKAREDKNKADPRIKTVVTDLSAGIEDIYINTTNNSRKEWLSEIADTDDLLDDYKQTIVDAFKINVANNVITMWAAGAATATQHFNVEAGIDESVIAAREAEYQNWGAVIGAAAGGTLGALFFGGPYGALILGSAGAAAGAFVGDRLRQWADAHNKKKDVTQDVTDVVTDLSTGITDLYVSKTQYTIDNWLPELDSFDNDELLNEYKQTILDSLKINISNNIVTMWGAGAATAASRFNIAMGIDEEYNKTIAKQNNVELGLEMAGGAAIGGIAAASLLAGPAAPLVLLGIGAGAAAVYFGNKIYNWINGSDERKEQEKVNKTVRNLAEQIQSMYVKRTEDTTSKWIPEIDSDTTFIDEYKEPIITSLKSSIATNVGTMWAAGEFIAIKKFNAAMGIDDNGQAIDDYVATSHYTTDTYHTTTPIKEKDENGKVIKTYTVQETIDNLSDSILLLYMKQTEQKSSQWISSFDSITNDTGNESFSNSIESNKDKLKEQLVTNVDNNISTIWTAASDLAMYRFTNSIEAQKTTNTKTKANNPYNYNNIGSSTTSSTSTTQQDDGPTVLIKTSEDGEKRIDEPYTVGRIIDDLSSSVVGTYIKAAYKSKSWLAEIDDTALTDEYKTTVVDAIKESVAGNVANMWKAAGAKASKQFNDAMGIDENGDTKYNTSKSANGYSYTADGKLVKNDYKSDENGVWVDTGETETVSEHGKTTTSSVPKFVTVGSVVDELSNDIQKLYLTKTEMSRHYWLQDLDKSDDFITSDYKDKILKELKGSVSGQISNMWKAAGIIVTSKFNILLGIDNNGEMDEQMLESWTKGTDPETGVKLDESVTVDQSLCVDEDTPTDSTDNTVTVRSVTTKIANGIQKLFIVKTLMTQKYWLDELNTTDDFITSGEGLTKKNSKDDIISRLKESVAGSISTMWKVASSIATQKFYAQMGIDSDGKFDEATVVDNFKLANPSENDDDENITVDVGTTVHEHGKTSNETVSYTFGSMVKSLSTKITSKFFNVTEYSKSWLDELESSVLLTDDSKTKITNDLQTNIGTSILNSFKVAESVTKISWARSAKQVLTDTGISLSSDIVNAMGIDDLNNVTDGEVNPEMTTNLTNLSSAVSSLWNSTIGNLVKVVSEGATSNTFDIDGELDFSSLQDDALNINTITSDAADPTGITDVSTWMTYSQDGSGTFSAFRKYAFYARRVSLLPIIAANRVNYAMNQSTEMDDYIKSVSDNYESLTSNIGNVWTNVTSGNVSGAISTEMVKDNIGLAQVNASVVKYILSPLGGMIRAGNEISKKIEETFGDTTDYDKDISSYMTTLNKYSTGNQTLAGFKKEQMAGIETDPIKKVISSLSNRIMYSYVSFIRAIDSMGDWFKTATSVDNMKSTISTSLSSVLSWAQGGSGDGIGGRGEQKSQPSTLNGSQYYSQNDPEWANKKFTRSDGKDDGATMSDTGCGPTAMSMVLSEVTGRNPNPTSIARDVQLSGDRDETGTNSNFVGKISNKYGVSSTRVDIPSGNDINTSLSNGNPVMLLGKDDGSGKSPYTRSGHYVVAVGKDGNNNIIINDPRGANYSKSVSPNYLASNTESLWSFGDGIGGSGIGHNSIYRRIHGGRGVDRTQWIATVRAVKQAIAAKNAGYSQSKWISITVGGKTLRVRTDCSGFVCACCQYYGVLPDSASLWTGAMLSSSSYMAKSGFFIRKWSGWDNLQEGDIMVNSSHTEIFCRNENGIHYVYNCGGEKSCNNPSATPSGHSSYSVVWSPTDPGDGAVTGLDVTSDGLSINNENFTNEVSSLFSSYANHLFDAALTGDFSKDWNDVLSGTSSLSSAAVSTTSSTGGNLSGDSTPVKVYNWLTSKGYSPAAAAGIIGNMACESGGLKYEGINPQSIQSPSQHAAGICQWESYKYKKDRWKQLSDYASSKGKDWTDLESQLEFMDMELQGTGGTEGTTHSLLNKKAGSYAEFKQLTSPENAAQIFEESFERAGVKALSTRKQQAKRAYDDLRNLGGSGEGILNGHPYYSQSDPEWANDKLLRSDGEDDGATMSDSGCGPTSMSMVLSDITDKKVDPTTVAYISKRLGNRDDTGTNMKFVGDLSSVYNIDYSQIGNPNTTTIMNALRDNTPVMMLGRGDGTNSSPYTPSGHYVVAVGMDNNNNVIINDPRGKSYSRSVNINNLANTTDVLWKFGESNSKNGYFYNPLTREVSLSGGRGISISGAICIGDSILGTMKSVLESKGATVFYQVSSNGNFFTGKVTAPAPGQGVCGVGQSFDWNKITNIKSPTCVVIVLGHNSDGSSGYTWTNELVTKLKSSLPNVPIVICSAITRGKKSSDSGAMSPSYINAYNTKVKTISNTTYIDIRSGYVASNGWAESSLVSSDGIHPNSTGASKLANNLASGLSGSASTDATPASSTTSTSSTTASSVDTSLGQISKVSSMLGTYGNHLYSSTIKNDFTKDWNEVLSDSSSGTSTGSSSSVSTVDSSSLSGSDTAEKMWNYLKGRGLSDAGAAAVLGNTFAESEIIPTNLQNSYEKPLGFTDDSYTKAVDSGSYSRFVNDSAGYGLAQWTYSSRKKNLLDRAKSSNKSIGDLGLQLDFLWSELNSGYPNLLNTLKTSNSVSGATSYYMTGFERPEDQSQSAKNTRSGYSNKYYDLYKGTKGGSGAGVSLTNKRYLDNTPVIPDTETLEPLQTNMSKDLNVKHITSGGKGDTSNIASYMDKIVQLLSTIANSNEKLNILNEIKSAMGKSGSVVANTVNNINNNAINNKQKSSGMQNTQISKNESIARQIAFGQ